MKSEKYIQLWLIFLNIKPKAGFLFNDLIDGEGNDSENNFIGAWANVLIKAHTIKEALQIAPLGLEELGFNIEFIDKIENVKSLIDNKEIKKEVIEEGDWLLDSNFVFRLSDRIFPYE